jgi:hypothetical protein
MLIRKSIGSKHWNIDLKNTKLDLKEMGYKCVSVLKLLQIMLNRGTKGNILILYYQKDFFS